MATSRRDFVKTAALGAGVAAAARPAPAQTSPNDTVNIGVAGFRGRGRAPFAKTSQPVPQDVAGVETFGTGRCVCEAG